MNVAPQSDLLGNRVLRIFGPEILELLKGDVETRHLPTHFSISEPGEPISFFCFPLTAVASTVTCMSDGDAIEAVTIGNEGIVGISAILGGTTGTLRSFIQVPGDGCLIPVDTFMRIVRLHPEVLQFLLKYANVLINVISQSAACNRLHNVVQRCARWLLTTADRARSDEFRLIQELLAEMVGSRRPTVSDAAATLQNAGLIQYRRGDVRILDRQGLETIGCECYRAISQAYHDLYTSSTVHPAPATQL
jgi:CRP-like cAMP-binding protein